MVDGLNENNKLSNWDKPGGGLAKFTLAGLIAVGLIGLWKLLPALITIASNAITLAALIGILAIIVFLFRDKKVRKVVSMSYFMLMRKITGLIIEIDPIAIVEKRIIDMKKKAKEISKIMGDLNGLIRDTTNQIMQNKESLDTLITRVNKQKEINAPQPEIIINERQILRLRASINNKVKSLEDSQKWYKILKKLQDMSNLTIQDTENEVKFRKEEFERVRKQHKAFKSVMSIMSGDVDEIEMFTQAMYYMANDINQKLGEMDDIISSTGSILKNFDLDSAVQSEQVSELLKKYDQGGIESLFTNFGGEQKALPESITPQVIETAFESNNKEKVLLTRENTTTTSTNTKSKYF